MLWILDLDGVMWLAEKPIAGSAVAVASLQQAGHRVVFVTNNAGPKLADLMAKFERFGIEVAPEGLFTSAQAASNLLEPGSTALICAGAGVVEALENRGVEVVREGDADAVVVGFHRDFDYDRLTAAFRAVRAGARLIATNEDPTYPTDDGPVPGGGAIVAAVERATGVAPDVAGKPHEPMADLIRSRLGDALGEGMFVGDSPGTDGLMAKRLGLPFGLVLSGVTPVAGDLGPGVDPVVVEDDLQTLVSRALS